MAAMLFVALGVPGAFESEGVLFGVAYLVVRLLHLGLSWVVARGDRGRISALVRFVPTTLAAASLLVAAGFVDGNARIGIWVVALGIDHLGPVVVGIALVSALWWLYFDVAAIFARNRLAEATGVERARLARDSYGYLHLPMVAGVVLLAFGVETTLHDVSATLGTVAAVALCGGAALYLLGHVAFLYRATRYLFRRRTAAAAALLVLIPVAGLIPALALLGLVTTVCWLVVAYEAIRHRTARTRIRHPDSPERPEASDSP